MFRRPTTCRDAQCSICRDDADEDRRQRSEKRKNVAAAVAFSVCVLGSSAIATTCTTQEKAVVRTVVDIARVVCTPQDTLDACVDKILADRQVKAARLARTRE